MEFFVYLNKEKTKPLNNLPKSKLTKHFITNYRGQIFLMIFMCFIARFKRNRFNRYRDISIQVLCTRMFVLLLFSKFILLLLKHA